MFGTSYLLIFVNMTHPELIKCKLRTRDVPGPGSAAGTCRYSAYRQIPVPAGFRLPVPDFFKFFFFELAFVRLIVRFVT